MSSSDAFLVGPLSLFFFFFFLLLFPAAFSSSSSPAKDANALLKFKSTLVDNRGVLKSWGSTVNPPCVSRRSNWTGIFCGRAGNIIKLILEDMSLSGSLDVSPLTGLHTLRSLSFMDNDFEGPMPAVGGFAGLRTLYLSGNKLSGGIPDDIFPPMLSLNKLHLARNRFSGPIPESLGKLDKLLELMLEENSLVGVIPELPQTGLKANLSHNLLSGPIPVSLAKLNPSAFMGNKALCGSPLNDRCVTDPTTQRSVPATSHQNSLAITAIVIISCIAFLTFVLVIFVLLLRRRSLDEEQLGCPSSKKGVPTTTTASTKRTHSRRLGTGTGGAKRAGGVENGRLAFVREGRERFELQDLLKASAEVLGSGSFGSSYKAVMPNGRAAVVKRFKEMNAVGREDFSEHMRRLGRLSHPNLLPLVAYYYRKEEKLLVFDYISNGSLAHMLHGNHGPNGPRKVLDWSARLRIIKGVGRGLSYLHRELPMLSLPHGHLKSSNVLLDDSFEPLLTDYSLVPVTNRSHATQVMVAFKSPEVLSYSQTTRKADVWSLGILILETLTGKFPTNYLLQGNDHGKDLAEWVASVAGRDGGEIFDKEMGGVGGQNEGELTKLLRIGMACCETDPARRLELAEAMDRIAGLKDGGEVEDFNSCVGEDGSFSLWNKLTGSSF